MIPCKENLVYFEDLNKKQVQIFPDACDYGIRSFGGRLDDEIMHNIKELKECYGGKANKWYGGSDFAIFIPFEMEGDAYRGVALRVGRHIGTPRFWSIDICPTTQTLSEAIEHYKFKN